MSSGIYGIKVGMTQIFNEQGAIVPVTILDIPKNVVVQQKTESKDGYVATQVGLVDKRENLATKPELGHLKASGVSYKRFLREISFKGDTKNELTDLKLGDEVSLEFFKDGDIIDVTAVSKGKGTEGNVTKYHQSRGPETHGSRYHRIPGSMGPIKGKEKGKHLPGRMGGLTTTTQNLEIIKIDSEERIILVKGAVPGPKKGLVFVKTAVKKGVTNAGN